MSLKDENRKEFQDKYEKSKEVSKNNIYFDIYGNQLRYDEFLDRVAEGKVVDVRNMDDNTFIARHLEYYPAKVDLENAQLPMDDYVRNGEPKDLKSALIDMQKQVEKTTKLFMRSSKEFKEFRKSLDELVKGDLNDPEALANKMEQVAQKADAYLKIKEFADAKITNNTKPRMAVANVVSVTFRNAINKMAEINKTIDQEKAEAKFVEERTAELEERDRIYKENMRKAAEKVNADDLEVVKSGNDFQKSLENDVNGPVEDDDDIEFIPQSKDKVAETSQSKEK